MCAPVHRYCSPLLLIKLLQVSHVGWCLRQTACFSSFHNVQQDSDHRRPRQNSPEFCSESVLGVFNCVFVKNPWPVTETKQDRIRASSTFHRRYSALFFGHFSFASTDRADVICQKALALSHLSNGLCPRSFVAHQHAFWQILLLFFMIFFQQRNRPQWERWMVRSDNEVVWPWSSPSISSEVVLGSLLPFVLSVSSTCQGGWLQSLEHACL